MKELKERRTNGAEIIRMVREHNPLYNEYIDEIVSEIERKNRTEFLSKNITHSLLAICDFEGDAEYEFKILSDELMFSLMYEEVEK